MTRLPATQKATPPTLNPVGSPVVTRSFSDPEELAAGIPEADGEFVQVSPGKFRAQNTRAELGQVKLHHWSTLPDTFGEMAIDRSALTLGMSLHCNGALLVYGKQVEPWKLFIPEGEFVRRGRNFQGVWIGMNREQVEATVCALLGVNEIRLPGGFLPGHDRLERALGSTMAAQVDAMAGRPERYADPAVCDVAEYALMSRALELLVAVCESARAAEDPPSDKARIVRRCNEYFDAVGDVPVSLADLAKAAGASARSLNYAFQNVCGVSPMRYFTLKRLGRARSALRRSDWQRGGVKRVALSTGCTHLGRFASEYRALFGELPSVTLAE
ncbi:MAG: helix-turn-helix transcriptional regulator [Myxococcales bacterium]|nr:helix-turn-helix transcriptional regulator [Myxococcales bacterium]